MAAHTHTTYSCDRCKCDLGSELPNHSQRTNVQARFDYAEGPGPVYGWTDLCDSCRAFVLQVFKVDPLPRLSATARKEARDYFTKLLAIPNADMADYAMWRARVLLEGKPNLD